MYSNLNGKPQPQARHPHSHEVMEIPPEGSAKAGRRHLKRVGVLGEHDLEAMTLTEQHKTQSAQVQAHHQHQHSQQEARLLTDPTLIGTGSVSSYYSGIRGPSSLRQQYLEGAGVGVGVGVPLGAAPVPGTVAITGAHAPAHMRRRADLREFSTNGSLRGAGSGSGSLYNAEINNFAAITALNQVHRPDASLVTASTSSNNGAATFLGLDTDMNMNSSMYPQHQHQHNPPSVSSRIGSTANAAGATQQLLVGADNNLMLAPLGVGQNVFVLPANQHQSQQLVYVQDQPAPSVHASEHSHSQIMNLVVGPNGQQYVTNIEAPSIYSADDQHMSAAVSAATHQAQAQAQAQNIISNQQLQQLSLQQQARTATAAAIREQHQRMQVTRLLLEERQRQTALYSSLQGAGSASVLDAPYLPTSSAQELLHQARMQGERQARLHGDNLFFADARSISGGMSELGESYLNGISMTGRAELPLSRSQVSVATSSQRSEDVHSHINPTPNVSNSVKDDIRFSNADKPRRPLSAYNFFFSEERERILAELDKNTEMSKEKEKENDAEDGGEDGKVKADGNGKEKERSREDMDKFLEGSPIEFTKEERKELEDKIRAKTQKILSVNLECDRPKKAPHRKSHGLGLRPLSKAIASRWRNLTEEKRGLYDRLAKQDLHRYKKSMKDCSLKLSSHYKKK